MKLANAAAIAFCLAVPASTAFMPSTKAFVRTSHPSIALRSAIEEDQFTTMSQGLVNGGIINRDSEYDNMGMKKIMGPTAVEVRQAAKAYMSKYEGQSGASAIYSKLLENGVEVVNGYSGGAVLPLLDQFHNDNPRHGELKKAPIRWITNSNESSAGHIAEGYAKSKPIVGDDIPVGVCVATSGPGVTNLITPLQDAICDGVPIMVLCGQAATVAPPDAFQQAPAVELTRPCTKWSYQIKSAAEVPFVMDYAFYIAKHGRPGPVFIDLPKDLQNQIVTAELIDDFVEKTLINDQPDETSFAKLVQRERADGSVFQALHFGNDKKGLAFEIENNDKLKPVTSSVGNDLHNADHHPTGSIYADSEVGALDENSPLFQKLQKIILEAKKPVLISGQGCNDCPEELTAFAEKLQIPVTATLHGMGSFDERNPLALNMMGMHGHATPNFLVQEADLIICVGSRFDDRITGRMSDFASKAREAAEERRGGIIHVDIRLTEKSKQVHPQFFVHSTGKKFLQTMNKSFEKLNISPKTGPWLKHKAELQAKYPITVPHFLPEDVVMRDENGNEFRTTRTKMSAQSVVKEMDRILCEAGKSDDCIFSTGVGIHQMVAAQLITWTRPRQMLSSGSLGTMGVAMGYAIGGKLANGKKMVIAVDGDGSFNMTFTELKTIAEQKIPVKLLVLDNESQMMVEYWQRLFHDKRLLAVRNDKNPDYRMLASAFGIKNLYVDREEDLEAVLKEFLFADPEEPVLLHARIERSPCLPMVAPGQPLHDMILEDVDFEVEAGAAPS